MKKLIILFIAFITLIGCGSGHQQEENTSEWGDSIATINNTAYYWLKLADDSARISAVRDNMLVTECIVRGPVYGARQYDDGESMNEVPDVVVSTRMGGMYAQQMRGYNRICVNPAFEMSKKSKMLTVGTHEYFKPRKDGTAHFEITSEIICHHAEMEKHQFDGITEADRKQVWGMFADNDQQVNGESLFLQYYCKVIHFSGEHRMDDKVIKDVLVPLIRSIVK